VQHPLEHLPIAKQIADILRDRNEKIALVETCTRGSITHLITFYPGSSDFFDSSVISYSYESQLNFIGLNREILETHGSVSAPAAKQLAQIIRDRAQVDWGISTTGIIGPNGGTETKPVGTLYVGISRAEPWDSIPSYSSVKEFHFTGNRNELTNSFTQATLEYFLSNLK
jgi:nicotinamide-nucleotide amidase